MKPLQKTMRDFLFLTSFAALAVTGLGSSAFAWPFCNNDQNFTCHFDGTYDQGKGNFVSQSCEVTGKVHNLGDDHQWTPPSDHDQLSVVCGGNQTVFSGRIDYSLAADDQESGGNDLEVTGWQTPGAPQISIANYDLTYHGDETRDATLNYVSADGFAISLGGQCEFDKR